MIKLLIVFFATTIISLPAFAHTQLASSTPEDGVTVLSAPEEIIMTFKHEIRLTKVTLARAGIKAITLKLDKNVTFQVDYTFALDDMSSGDYSIEWRGLGKDGHVMKGQFAYSVE